MPAEPLLLALKMTLRPHGIAPTKPVPRLKPSRHAWPAECVTFPRRVAQIVDVAAQALRPHPRHAKKRPRERLAYFSEKSGDFAQKAAKHPYFSEKSYDPFGNFCGINVPPRCVKYLHPIGLFRLATCTVFPGFVAILRLGLRIPFAVAWLGTGTA